MFCTSARSVNSLSLTMMAFIEEIIVCLASKQVWREVKGDLCVFAVLHVHVIERADKYIFIAVESISQGYVQVTTSL